MKWIHARLIVSIGFLGLTWGSLTKVLIRAVGVVETIWGIADVEIQNSSEHGVLWLLNVDFLQVATDDINANPTVTLDSQKLKDYKFLEFQIIDLINVAKLSDMQQTNKPWIRSSFSIIETNSSDKYIFNISIPFEGKIWLKEKGSKSQRLCAFKINNGKLIAVIKNSEFATFAELFKNEIWLNLEFVQETPTMSLTVFELLDFPKENLSDHIAVFLNYREIDMSGKHVSNWFSSDIRKNFISAKCHLNFVKIVEDGAIQEKYFGIGEIRYIKGEPIAEIWIQKVWFEHSMSFKVASVSIDKLQGVKRYSLALRKGDNEKLPKSPEDLEWIHVKSDIDVVKANPVSGHVIVPCRFGIPKHLSCSDKNGETTPVFYDASEKLLTVMETGLTDLETYRTAASQDPAKCSVRTSANSSIIRRVEVKYWIPNPQQAPKLIKMLHRLGLVV